MLWLKDLLLSTFAGLVVGFLFAFIKLPIPAPPNLVGVMGIVGIFLGYMIFKWIFGG